MERKKSITLFVYENISSVNQAGSIEICFSRYSGCPAYIIIRDANGIEYYETDIVFAELIVEIQKASINNVNRSLIQKLGLEVY